MQKITITRQTIVKHPKGGGQSASPGDVFTVGDNVSAKDARDLVGIKKAVEGDQSEDYKKEIEKDKPTKPATKKDLEKMDAEGLRAYVESIDLEEVSGNQIKFLKKLWKGADIADDFPKG